MQTMSFCAPTYVLNLIEFLYNRTLINNVNTHGLPISGHQYVACLLHYMHLSSVCVWGKICVWSITLSHIAFQVMLTRSKSRKRTQVTLLYTLNKPIKHILLFTGSVLKYIKAKNTGSLNAYHKLRNFGVA